MTIDLFSFAIGAGVVVAVQIIAPFLTLMRHEMLKDD